MDKVISLISFLCVAAAFVYVVVFCLLELGWIKKKPSFIRISLPSINPYIMIGAGFVLFTAAIYIGCTMLAGAGGMTFERFIEMWSGPDTEHYVRISRYGYQPGTEYENLIVFYPLFPLAMRIFGLIIPSPELAGMVISNLAMLGAAMLLYRLCELCGMTRGQGFLAVAFMLVYPFVMFTRSCYTESLFLLLTIGCAVAVKKRRWLLCAVLGMLAALTRLQGVLCLAMAVYEFVHNMIKDKPADKRQWAKGLWLLLIPLGYVIYLMINHVLYGNAFAFMAFEKAPPWYQDADWFFNNLASQFNLGVEHSGLAAIIYAPQILLFFTVLAVLTAGIKTKINTGLMLYGLVMLIVSYTASWMISGGRYMLAVFPVFMVMSKLTYNKKYLAPLLLVCSAALMLYYNYCFLLGYAIM